MWNPPFLFKGHLLEINRTYSGLEAKFFELSNKIVEEAGLKLYDMEYVSGSSTLRVYIINSETNTAQLEECVKVDRAFSPFTEELEWIPESLILEVSSPGVFRNLSCLEHFENVLGERVKLSLSAPISAAKFSGAPKDIMGSKKVIGILKSINQQSIEIAVGEFVLSLPFDEIKKANLEPEL